MGRPIKTIKINDKSLLKVGDRVGDKIVSLNGNQRILIEFPKRFY